MWVVLRGDLDGSEGERAMGLCGEQRIEDLECSMEDLVARQVCLASVPDTALKGMLRVTEE